MITHHNGDVIDALFRGDIDVIFHQANCTNTMGSGIAKQIRERIPEAYAADTACYNFFQSEDGEDLQQLGDVSKGGNVYNLYGQDGYTNRRKGKQDTVYWALFKALTGVKEDSLLILEGEPSLKDKRIGIPHKMGCDRGGGDWSLVQKFIEIEYADYDVHIYKL